MISTTESAGRWRRKRPPPGNINRCVCPYPWALICWDLKCRSSCSPFFPPYPFLFAPVWPFIHSVGGGGAGPVRNASGFSLPLRSRPRAAPPSCRVEIFHPSSVASGTTVNRDLLLYTCRDVIYDYTRAPTAPRPPYIGPKAKPSNWSLSVQSSSKTTPSGITVSSVAVSAHRPRVVFRPENVLFVFCFCVVRALRGCNIARGHGRKT